MGEKSGSESRVTSRELPRRRPDHESSSESRVTSHESFGWRGWGLATRRLATRRLRDDALVITGPTAVGKTAVAIAVAKRLDGEVISMDSRQVYRGMDIGTAKPTLAERQGVPHHGFDRVDPNERYSAGRFAREAREWIFAIRHRGRVPILAGGTGFFLRALTHPLFREPELDAGRRRALDQWLASRPNGELLRWAETLDPGAGGMLGGGRQRLSRLIEVALLTGRPISWWHTHAASDTQPPRLRVVVLALDRAALRKRIDERVVHMVEHGLVDEVRKLIARGYGPEDPGVNATGYAELIPFLRGERTLEDAIALTQAATRRYARRQMTWFRNQLPDGATWLDAECPVDALANTIARLMNCEATSSEVPTTGNRERGTGNPS